MDHRPSSLAAPADHGRADAGAAPRGVQSDQPLQLGGSDDHVDVRRREPHDGYVRPHHVASHAAAYPAVRDQVRLLIGGSVRKIVIVLIGVIGLMVSLLAQEPAPERAAPWWPKLAGEFTPTAPDEIINGPVPRMADGHPDLHGPWVGGGSNGDVEKDGGLKPGELPLLPWAKMLRDSRREKDEPYLYCTPMSVPRVNPY